MYKHTFICRQSATKFTSKFGVYLQVSPNFPMHLIFIVITLVQVTNITRIISYDVLLIAVVSLFLSFLPYTIYSLDIK